jgi:CTP-dependent riboflavin kinase
MQGVEILPADSAFCAARALPVKVGGIDAIIIMPDPSVRVHAKNVVEIIAGVGLKDTLGVDDGDPLALTIFD